MWLGSIQLALLGLHWILVPSIVIILKSYTIYGGVDFSEILINILRNVLCTSAYNIMIIYYYINSYLHWGLIIKSFFLLKCCQWLPSQIISWHFYWACAIEFKM